jgi:ribosome-interacting GTPase 1
LTKDGGGSSSRKNESNKLKVMNDEIERVERVMKRTSSRNSTTHEDRELSRKTSHADSPSSGLDPRKALKESKHPITRICLTGGPCAGKTTALATLSVVLQ